MRICIAYSYLFILILFSTGSSLLHESMPSMLSIAEWRGAQVLDAKGTVKFAVIEIIINYYKLLYLSALAYVKCRVFIRVIVFISRYRRVYL